MQSTIMLLQPQWQLDSQSHDTFCIKALLKEEMLYVYTSCMRFAWRKRRQDRGGSSPKRLAEKYISHDSVIS